MELAKIENKTQNLEHVNSLVGAAESKHVALVLQTGSPFAGGERFDVPKVWPVRPHDEGVPKFPRQGADAPGGVRLARNL